MNLKARASRSAVASFVVLLALGSTEIACAQAGADAPLATVDDKPITEADVEASVSDQLKQMEREYASARKKLLEDSLQQVIQDRLLEAEAAKRGVSKDQLLAEIKPAAVTDADVDAFYEQNKAQIPRPKEQVAAQIKDYLQNQGEGAARQKLLDDIRKNHAVKILIEPERVSVAATGPAKGPANAPVTIVEFSDFQCPYCSRLNPTLEQVFAKYGDKVRLVFRQYPLNFHQFAQKAAEASLCAHEQDKFWQLHDAMFANQQALGVDQLKAKAAELGLDADKFAQCLDSGKHADAVAADFKAGSEAGVSGTPAMFINGRFISGAVPLEQITVVIDDELQRKSGK